MHDITSQRTDDNTIEQEIQAKGLTAPRITPADLEANIASTWYINAGEGVTPDDFMPPVPANHPPAIVDVLRIGAEKRIHCYW